MSCFNMTLTLLLSIAVFHLSFTMTFQEDSLECLGKPCYSKADCHSDDCPDGVECIYVPGVPLPGFCSDPGPGNGWNYHLDECRTDEDCPSGQECTLDFTCQKPDNQGGGGIEHQVVISTDTCKEAVSYPS